MKPATLRAFSAAAMIAATASSIGTLYAMILGHQRTAAVLGTICALIIFIAIPAIERADRHIR